MPNVRHSERRCKVFIANWRENRELLAPRSIRTDKEHKLRHKGNKIGKGPSEEGQKAEYANDDDDDRQQRRQAAKTNRNGRGPIMATI